MTATMPAAANPSGTTRWVSALRFRALISLAVIALAIALAFCPLIGAHDATAALLALAALALLLTLLALLGIARVGALVLFAFSVELHTIASRRFSDRRRGCLWIGPARSLRAARLRRRVFAWRTTGGASRHASDRLDRRRARSGPRGINARASRGQRTSARHLRGGGNRDAGIGRADRADRRHLSTQGGYKLDLTANA
jgi:hypothetical protein